MTEENDAIPSRDKAPVYPETAKSAVPAAPNRPKGNSRRRRYPRHWKTRRKTDAALPAGEARLKENPVAPTEVKVIETVPLPKPESMPAESRPEGPMPTLKKSKPAPGSKNREKTNTPPLPSPGSSEVPAPKPDSQAENAFLTELRVNLIRQAEKKHLKFPGLDTGKARKHLLQFIKAQAEASALQQAVIGLSGGLHSAVVAGLVVEALSPQRVLLVHSLGSNQGMISCNQAGLIARYLRCPLEMIDLRPIIQVLLPNIPETLLPHQQNRLLRERQAALLELSEIKPGRALIGTLDKTQRLLGYGAELDLSRTAWLPLGDLYYSQVRELAKAIGVPKEILEKESSWEVSSRWDKEKPKELNGKELDYYLFQMVDMKIALTHLYWLGLEEEKLRWIYHQLHAASLKMDRALVPEALSVYEARSYT